MNPFPILTKELTELAARRRTYMTRVIFAGLLFGCSAGFIGPKITYAAGAWPYVTGSGGQYFLSLVLFLALGIHLFLPAFAAGLITQEKERDSLALLFLTGLKPWQILLQKYASGLVAIFSFLLTGLPLAALCYTYGGLSRETLIVGVYVLFLTSLQIGALALLCSARARTTVGAFVGTYLLGAVLATVICVTAQWLDHLAGGTRYSDRSMGFFPWTQVIWIFRSGPTFGAVFQASLPAIGSIVVFLLLARFYLVRRAFAPARHRLLGLFRRVDSFMQSANRRIGGVTFHTRDRALPGDDPIAWRELTRTLLGRPQYLARLLLGLEIPTVAVCLWAVAAGGEGGALSEVAAVFGTLSVLALSAFSANAFVSERVSQTFEVLLTTPLRAEDIVRQKTRMLSRFQWMLAVPLLTIFAVRWWLERDWPHGQWQHPNVPAPPLYLFTAVLTLAVYLPLVQWLSLWVGLKMRTRFRAIVTALAVVAGWCVLPLMLCSSFDANQDNFLLQTSPLAVPVWNEGFDLDRMFPVSPLLGVLVNFLIYGAITAFIRHRCLSRADVYLRG